MPGEKVVMLGSLAVPASTGKEANVLPGSAFPSTAHPHFPIAVSYQPGAGWRAPRMSDQCSQLQATFKKFQLSQLGL